MLKLIIIFLLIFTILSSSAIAELNNSRLELNQTKTKIHQSETKQKILQKDLLSLEKELLNLRNEGSLIARKLRKHENEIFKIEKALKKLETKKTKMKHNFTKQKKQLSLMISSLLRLSRTPKEASLVMPTGFSDKIQASRSLGMMSENMHHKIIEISKKLMAFKLLQTKINNKKDDIKKEDITLDERRNYLTNIISRRKKLMKKINSEALNEQKYIANLSKKSKDLKSLIANLELERIKKKNAKFSAIGKPIFRPSDNNKNRKNENRISQYKSPITSKNIRSFMLAKGNIKLPVNGIIISQYGEIKNGNTSKGIKIKARNNAQITAPYDGEIMYAGAFRDYGLVVIIRHSDNYHTLLAGLGRIDCEAGQTVKEGEPIGIMAMNNDKLYVELRKKSKAINPKGWMIL